MNTRYRLLTAVLSVLLVSAAVAQDRGSDTVYRCGADGKTYSDSACPDGRAIAAADARSAEQRRQAEDVVRRDRDFADRMAKEREQRERNAPGAVGIGSTPAVKATTTAAANGPKKSPRKKKPKKAVAEKQRA